MVGLRGGKQWRTGGDVDWRGRVHSLIEDYSTMKLYVHGDDVGSAEGTTKLWSAVRRTR